MKENQRYKELEGVLERKYQEQYRSVEGYSTDSEKREGQRISREGPSITLDKKQKLRIPDIRELVI